MAQFNQRPPADKQIHPGTLRGQRQSHLPGTLLWIGNRDGNEFREIYQYCETLVPQLALRRNLRDCLDRPASGVAGVVITRQTREEFCQADLSAVEETYRGATMVQLLGSLCAGERPRSVGPFGERTIYAFQWNQYLPTWLGDCGIVPVINPRSTFSIAVVANTLPNAQPLMDLAASTGAATLWCKRPSTNICRNVDVVWWDESAARPTTSSDWSDRLAAFDSPMGEGNRQRRHVWLASWPRREQTRAAIAGGVQLVVSKPYEVSLLFRSIGANVETEPQVVQHVRHAA
ncbi:hypothetical protein [Planctomycetes bacterium K23_9]|uniref:Uncharacterized protein n=1 Tax=Stieleria marina TaxID=1930275 RepID=A0A517P0Z0_9BACT|nr:hypothetical protein K239x_50590 [Planctomycetes bacterium K23_9]